MKTFRAWLLLMLALLLPVRGAAAAAMLCPMAGAGSHAEHRLQQMPDAPMSMNDAADGHAHVSAIDHAGMHHGADEAAARGMPDGCHSCAAFCSLTPLLSAMPTLPLFAAVQSPFPSLAAPVPTVVPAGEERPPRSC